MPRAGVDADKIVETAAKIVDERGLDSVSLKAISSQLNVSSPSLYKHIDGLPELKEKISHYAMGMLRDSLIRATIQKAAHPN